MNNDSLQHLSSFKAVTTHFPDTLILITYFNTTLYNNRGPRLKTVIDSYDKLTEVILCYLDYYHPFCPDDENKHNQKKAARWKHFFSFFEKIWVPVVVWSPAIRSPQPNTHHWGFLHIPSFLMRRGGPMIQKAMCHPTIPVLYQPRLTSLHQLYSPPTQECTLPEFEKAVQRRVDLYCKLKKKQKVTAEDVLLTDLEEDTLGFNGIALGLNIQSPMVLFSRHHMMGREFREIVKEFMLYEIEIARYRLQSCLSHQMDDLFFADVRPKTEVLWKDVPTDRKSFPSGDIDPLNPFTWMNRGKGKPILCRWFLCPFEATPSILISRSALLDKGKLWLHNGHALELLSGPIVKQVIEQYTLPLRTTSGIQLPDERIITILRRQLGRIWQVTAENPVEVDAGFLRNSVGLSELQQVAPPCIMRMLLAITHPPSKKSNLPPLGHHAKFLFTSFALRFGVQTKELIEVMKRNVHARYPKDEWDKREQDEKYQIEHLVRSGKKYQFGCRQLRTVTDGNTWCVYGKDAQPQHRCAKSLGLAEPAFISSPWNFVIEKRKKKRKEGERGVIRMEQ